MVISGHTKIFIATTLTAVAGVLFASTLLRIFFYFPEEEFPIFSPAPLSAASMAVEVSEPPVRLHIPSLALEVSVEEVGLTVDGAMATPQGFKNVGWYKHGVLPGNRGSAVFAGHVDNAVGFPGVFKHLHKIKTGDGIYVETMDGQGLWFEVEAVEVYPYDEVPTEILFNRKDAVRLNLITCIGDWLSKEKTYDHRLVVYAVLKEKIVGH